MLVAIITTLQNISPKEYRTLELLNYKYWSINYMNIRLRKVQNLVKQYKMLKLKFDVDIFHIENDFPLLKANFN